jgi:hypothetical protein
MDCYDDTWFEAFAQSVYEPVGVDVKPCAVSGQSRDRTGDLRIFSPSLYQLSYLSVLPILEEETQRVNRDWLYWLYCWSVLNTVTTATPVSANRSISKYSDPC